MKIRQLVSFLFLCSFLVVSIDVYAEIPNFNRQQHYDVQHYTLKVSFDRQKKQIFGETTIQLKPLKANFITAEFDAVGLTFESVTSGPPPSGGGQFPVQGSVRPLTQAVLTAIPLKFETKIGKVVVNLDKKYSTGETILITFKYTAEPKKGIYFVPELTDDGQQIHSDQIWTQGEPDEARHWFPSFDFPSDKATTEQLITVNEGETVVGNGELVEQIKNDDGTVTFHYKMAVPLPTYLVSFVVGKYAKVADKYRDIPLGFYVYPGTEDIVPKAYGRTKAIFRVFENVTRIDYPFNKYDQTIVASFHFGGMENITATTMADIEIFAADNPLFAGNTEDLVSHELAHSWFGNLVTCRNWAELWLNEGFATFMEAVSREKLYGRKNYLLKIQSDAETFLADDAVNQKRNGLFNRNAGDVSQLFTRPATTYDKGGAVLHTLREQVGDKAFWQAVNTYLNRHKFGSVESSDLKRAMEEASGQKLDWFFAQWVYGLGAPKLDVRPVYKPQTKTLTLTVTQTQSRDKLTPTAFRLPLELEIKTDGKTRKENFVMTKRLQTFSFRVSSKPDELTLDPREKIPLKTVRMRRL